MNGNKEYFNELEEKNMEVHIELGDNGKYTTMGVGVVIFDIDYGNSIHIRDVLYVPGLKKNLVLLATLEDKGYEVILNKGKAYLKHLASRLVK